MGEKSFWARPDKIFTATLFFMEVAFNPTQIYSSKNASF